nr:MAG TPA: helix-turn-helix domain protein [Bacteriophage sp.]
MNTVERTISICKERKIPISRLEKECGMSNGYIKGLKKGTIPDDKLKKISEYLNLDLEYLATGKEKDVPSFSPDHIELISAYDKLSNADKLAIMQIIKSLSAK